LYFFFFQHRSLHESGIPLQLFLLSRHLYTRFPLLSMLFFLGVLKQELHAPRRVGWCPASSPFPPKQAFLRRSLSSLRAKILCRQRLGQVRFRDDRHSPSRKSLSLLFYVVFLPLQREIKRSISSSPRYEPPFFTRSSPTPSQIEYFLVPFPSRLPP